MWKITEEMVIFKVKYSVIEKTKSSAVYVIILYILENVYHWILLQIFYSLNNFNSDHIQNYFISLCFLAKFLQIQRSIGLSLCTQKLETEKITHDLSDNYK